MEPLEDERILDLPGEAPGEGAVTEEDKIAVHKVHKAEEHPQRAEFIRYLRAGRVGEVV